jgi:exosortase C (VPDSG-CTERM-specific)
MTHLSEPLKDKDKRVSRRLLGVGAVALSLCVLFARPLVALAAHAAQSDLNSHILLVPFVSAYLVYLRRDLLPRDYTCSWGWAMIPLVAGGGALAGAWIPDLFGAPLSQNDYLALVTFSLLCFLATGGLLFLGKKWMVAAAFPFTFLIFMVPMPDRMADALETASELASTEAASFFFDLAGTPVLRDGTTFQLPNIAIRVAKECSGIRSSWVLIVTSLLAANLFLHSTWRRVVLVCLVIPLGILRNGFRIMVVGLLCVHLGPQMIHSVIHRHGGPLFFALSLIPLFLLLWWLRRGEAGTWSGGAAEPPRAGSREASVPAQADGRGPKNVCEGQP